MKSISSVALIIVGNSIAGGGGAERRFFRLWKYFIFNHSPLHLIINYSLYETAINAKLLTSNDLASQWLHVVPDGNTFTLSKSIFQAIKQHNISLVHLVLAQKILLPFYFLLKFNSSIIVTHTVALSWFAHPYKVPLLTFLLNRFLWKISKKIDSLYTGFLQQNARTYHFDSKVSISPCSFTDIERFTQEHEKEKIIVFAGRLIPEKNPLLLVKALQLLGHELLLGWKIIIAGDGPLKDQILNELKNSFLKALIKIKAYPDMSVLFCKSSIFVSLQETENYPSQSLLEAMISKNAVIATNAGETHRLIKHENTGILIEADAQQLADALFAMISNHTARGRISEAGKKFIIENHKIEIFADYIKRIWESALIE